ncbi:SPASM domain-containing protein [Chryseolinea sp. H1M3-3]|uniref:SPASM domain-containing protein n=1 Tax=Chryseolinea sp. H1M3-3 TaxID=3034144 RepID=UPI0023EDD141|nr:SPASM domain-containing protein [Chryseolinea sp. H1M3-3]
MIGGFQDSLNMISRLTPKRLVNASRIFSSYQFSRWTGTPAIKGMPISIAFEPTTSCNLRCPECPSGLRSFSRPTGMLNSDLFRDVIDQLAPTLNYLTFYFQGEPYLHPQFLAMVKYASDKGVYTATSTNGHFLKDDVARATVESSLDRLIISIDGTTQDTYQSYRIGGSLEKVIEGTRHIISWKKKLKSKTPQVVFQFLVVKPNEHQIPEVYAVAKKLGVDQVVLKTAQIYDFEKGSNLIPEQQQYSRYKKNQNGTYSIKNKLDNHCWKMWHSCVITWDGKVVPCCFDKDAHFTLGELTKQSFAEIWYGNAYKEFRTTLLRSRREIEICKNCTEGTKVWA